MLFKSKFFRVICVFCLMFSLASWTLADTIRLKDGSIIKGKIVNFTGGKFTVVIGDGSRQRQMNFYADEVESIEFEAIPNLVADNKPPTQLPVKSNTSNNSSNTNKSNTDTNIITIGETNKNNNPQTTSPKTNTNQPANPNTTNTNPSINNSTTSTTNPNSTGNTSRPQPIKLTVKVLADNTANGWTNSGWVVKKGQKIRIAGSTTCAFQSESSLNENLRNKRFKI